MLDLEFLILAMYMAIRTNEEIYCELVLAEVERLTGRVKNVHQ